MDDYDNELSDYPPSNYSRPPAYSSGGRKDGYSPVPQSEYNYPPPSGYIAPGPPPSSSYAPAPPMMQQQSNNNVVIGNQPATPPSVVHAPPDPRANEYMTISCALLFLCFIHGNLPAVFICIAPALLCASAARDHNNAGDYASANSCGRAALGCNIFAMVYFVLLILAGISAALLWFFYLRFHVDDITNIINNAVDDITTHTCCYNGNCYTTSGRCLWPWV